MGFIIKPVVTEKMTKITDKSSEDKKITAPSEKAGKRHNATAEIRKYVVKNRRHPEGINKEKTVYTYTKIAQPKYGFIVKPEANKLEIKKEIESLYNVTVIDVNTIRYAGKRQARYTKAGLVKGQKNAFKKAIVTLKEGDTIDFYSNI
ncbi:50S ribosomal protein L23 [Prevotella brunnea]|uniref:Large ribosomal subunit protein uL23 n=1 Tax=Prevotella brunnea TaxID=2508867 RepID=A0A5C8GKZ5_9BACT|nr:50S ribosomal protein L23 [Prevotella brunnea]MDR0185909.1 50S ribosomal protein L23 [Prevotella brunnea]TXJ62633.1 50S ribosomal protein L23 [Prevotella brunnea]